MINPNIVQYQKTRQNELLHEAGAHRRNTPRTEQFKPNGNMRLYANALSKLGDTLVTVGTELQTRYGDLIEEA